MTRFAGERSVRSISGKTKKNVFIALLATIAITGFSCKKDAPEPETESTAKIQLGSDGVVAATTVTATNLTGNGVADNLSSLQSQINTAAAQRKALKLPAGKFVISDRLILPSNAWIEGAGASTEIFLTNGSAAGRNVFKINKGTANVTLKNLKINANQAGNTGKDLVAMLIMEGVNTVTAEGVTFAGGRDRGVVQVLGLNTAQTTGLKFNNCQFPESGRTAIELRGTKNSVISNCTFTNWGSQNANSPAVQLQSQDNINTQITSNTFNNTLGIQFAIECAAAYVTDSKIQYNKLNDPKNLGGNGISGYYKRTEISNNTFSGGNGNHRSGLEIFGNDNKLLYNTIPAGSIAIAPNKTEDAANILIQGNNVKTKGSNAAGIQMGGGGYSLKTVKVIGNTVDTRGATGNSSAIVVGTYGSRRPISDITVESNTLYSNAFDIRLESLAGSKDIYLNRNTCKAGMNWLGIVTATFTNVKATGNVKEMANKAVMYSVSMPAITEY
jgi:hypothetical protein